jgi:hypothetical protein
VESTDDTSGKQAGDTNERRATSAASRKKGKRKRRGIRLKPDINPE